MEMEDSGYSEAPDDDDSDSESDLHEVLTGQPCDPPSGPVYQFFCAFISINTKVFTYVRLLQCYSLMWRRYLFFTSHLCGECGLSEVNIFCQN